MDLHPNAGQRPQRLPAAPAPRLQPHSGGGPAGHGWGHHWGATRHRVSAETKPALSGSCRSNGSPASSPSARIERPRGQRRGAPKPPGRDSPRFEPRHGAAEPAEGPDPRDPADGHSDTAGEASPPSRLTRPRRAREEPARAPHANEMLMKQAAAAINCWKDRLAHSPNGSRAAGGGQGWQRGHGSATPGR